MAHKRTLARLHPCKVTHVVWIAWSSRCYTANRISPRWNCSRWTPCHPGTGARSCHHPRTHSICRIARHRRKIRTARDNWTWSWHRRHRHQCWRPWSFSALASCDCAGSPCAGRSGMVALLGPLHLVLTSLSSKWQTNDWHVVRPIFIFLRHSHF